MVRMNWTNNRPGFLHTAKWNRDGAISGDLSKSQCRVHAGSNVSAVCRASVSPMPAETGAGRASAVAPCSVGSGARSDRCERHVA